MQSRFATAADVDTGNFRPMEENFNAAAVWAANRVRKTPTAAKTAANRSYPPPRQALYRPNSP
jgi:hypothetical protein